MIIPWLRGVLSWKVAPVTWAIILTNVLIFLTSLDQRVPHLDFSEASEIVRSGQLYFQFKNPGKNHLSLSLEENEWLVMGSEALRDPRFVKEASDFAFVGDQVEINRWKVKLSDFRHAMGLRQTSMFGLSVENQGPLSWITYQFTHAGLLHLFGNMLMLLIFGAAVELKMGGFILVAVHILGGIFGGFGFFILSPASLLPMVGASGSISAIMAFYTASERKKRVPCFYFIAPIDGLLGQIHLPTWMLYPLCFLPDLAGYLSTPAELGGGVAYSAHIGGAVFGLALGFFWRFKLKQFEFRTDTAMLETLKTAPSNDIAS